jgi:hypothetical protein
VKKYYLFLDILGFDSLPRVLATMSEFKEDFIREQCFSRPVESRISKIEQMGYSIIRGTDNYVILVNDLDSVFTVINIVTSARTNHKRVRFVPIELAIDIKEIEDYQITDYKNRKATIQFLKNNIISAYKNYFKEHHGESIKETFVIYTPAFHEELKSTDRHIFSQQINHNDKNFYLADLDVMRDIEGTLTSNRIAAKKFLDKVTFLGFWDCFEIKSFMYRISGENTWKLQFLYVRLLEENLGNLQRLQRKHFILVHEIRAIIDLPNLVDQMIKGREVRVQNLRGSLELKKNILKCENYMVNQSFPTDFGLESSCFALIEHGDRISLSRETERMIEAEIASEYEDLTSAVRYSMGLQFWTKAYYPFVVLLAPLPIRVALIEYDGNRLHIRLDCSVLIDFRQLKIALYLRDAKDSQIGTAQTLIQFNRSQDREVIINHDVQFENNVTSVRLNLIYSGNTIEEHFLIKENNHWIHR